MEHLGNFLSTKKGKLILIIITIILVVGIGVLLWSLPLNNSPKEELTETKDPSGLTIISTNAEPEGDSTDPLIIGYQIFYDAGFSFTQQTKIYDTTLKYFIDNYPSVQRISYKEGSLYYPDLDNISKSSFVIITNEGSSFKVDLDTNFSYTNVDISINSL